MSFLSQHERFVPITLAGIIFFGALAITIYSMQTSQNEVEDSTSEALTLFGIYLKDKITIQIDLVDQLLVRQWIDVTNESQLFDYNRYLEIVPSFFNYSGQFLAINWINTSGVVNWVYPFEPNKSVINVSIIYTSDGAFNDAFAYAQQTGNVGITNFIPFFQGGFGFACYIPIIVENEITGYFNVVYLLTELIENVFENQPILSDFSLIVEERGSDIIELNEEFEKGDNFVQTQTIEFYNKQWKLYCKPLNRDILSIYIIPIPIFVISTILATLVYFFLNVSKERNKLQRAEFLERERISKMLFQEEKLRSLGTLAGGIAHDFNNLLMHLQGHLSLLRDYYVPELYEEHGIKDENTIAESLTSIQEGISRAAELSKQILTFSRFDTIQWNVIRLQEPLIEALQIVRETSDRRIDISYDAGPETFIIGDHTRIVQVFLNAILNSIQAVDPVKGIIKIEINQHKDTLHSENFDKLKLDNQDKSFAEDKVVCIRIIDNGRGIPEEDISRVFEPFFTTKDKGKGTGLGLAILYQNIKQMGGTVKIESKPNERTVLTIHLPIILQFRQQEVEFESPILSKDESEVIKTILLVDDEEAILNSCSMLLKNNGYEVFSATDGWKASKLFQDISQDVDVVITDINMPKMNGIKLIEKIRQIVPDQPIIVITGYSDNMVEFYQQEDIQVITKPFEIDELIELIENFEK